MLVDPPPSTQLKYLDRIWESLNWLRRHYHLTTLTISHAGQLIDRARALVGKVVAEIQLEELLQIAGKSAGIQETIYRLELHFFRMVRIANASAVPLLLAWLPAPPQTAINCSRPGASGPGS